MKLSFHFLSGLPHAVPDSRIPLCSGIVQETGVQISESQEPSLLSVPSLKDPGDPVLVAREGGSHWKSVASVTQQQKGCGVVKGGLSKDKDLKDVHVVADFAISALQPVLNFIQKCQALVYFRARSVGRFTSMHFSQHFLVTRGWCRETRKKLRDGNIRKTKATYTVSREPGKQTGDLGEAPGEGGSGRRKKGNLVLQIPKSLLRKAASWEKLAASSRVGIRPSWWKPLGIQSRRETTKAHCFVCALAWLLTTAASEFW